MPSEYTSQQMKKRALIIEIATEKEVLSCGCSPAGYNFCRNIVLSKIFDASYSLVPWQVKDKVKPTENIGIHYIQSRKKIPFIGKIFNFVLDSISLIRNVKHSEFIWFYNLTLHTLLAYIYLRFILRKKVFVVLADFDNKPTFFSVSKILSVCIGYAQGIISLSARSFFSNHKNFSVLPGFAPECKHEDNSGKLHADADNMFLYAGAISKPWGAMLLVDTFAMLPEIRLSISGPISLPSGGKELFFEKISKLRNVSYKGLLPIEEYNLLLEKSSVLLSLRDPDFYGNQNNFPSKLIEALLHGKEVVSTMEYPELKLGDGCVISYVKYSKEALADCIRDLYSKRKDSNFWNSRRTQNFRWLTLHVSKDSWQNTISKLEQNS